MLTFVKRSFAKIGLFAATMTVAVGTGAAQAVPVNMELVLAIDVSTSVDATEFALQRDGTADAIAALTDFQPFAATLVYWSHLQTQALPWTLITDSASAIAFANAIKATTRPFGGFTGIAWAIDFSSGLFDNNGFEGNRLVIDISGDGLENRVSNTELKAARDAAYAKGITINGVAIGGQWLADHYTDHVITATIGDPNGLPVFMTLDFDGFADAIAAKVAREVSIPGNAVPEPMTAGLGILSVLALGASMTRRRHA